MIAGLGRWHTGDIDRPFSGSWYAGRRLALNAEFVAIARRAFAPVVNDQHVVRQIQDEIALVGVAR